VRLDAKVRANIEAALAPGGPCEGMRLLVVGHSLGAGVASLLAIRWRSLGVFPDVECVAFAAPCIVSGGLGGAVQVFFYVRTRT